jgi:hypothetical protein
MIDTRVLYVYNTEVDMKRTVLEKKLRDAGWIISREEDEI